MLQTLKNFLKDVADAIREKTGKTEKIATKDMATQILTIQSEMPSEWGEFYHSQDENGNYTGVSFFGKVNKSRMYGPPASSHITEVKLLDDITKIPDTFAKNNEILKKVIYEGDITEIAEGAFQACTNLETLQNIEGESMIHPMTTKIGNYAFMDCNKLKVKFGYSPYNPDLTIGDYAFYRSSTGRNIMDDELPRNINSIGQYAFRYQQIPFTKVPSAEIKAYAFEGNNAITSITIGGIKVGDVYNGGPIASTAFASCSNLTDIYVPWAEGVVANAPWGATNATIHYNYTE